MRTQRFVHCYTRRLIQQCVVNQSIALIWQIAGLTFKHANIQNLPAAILIKCLYFPSHFIFDFPQFTAIYEYFLSKSLATNMTSIDPPNRIPPYPFLIRRSGS